MSILVTGGAGYIGSHTCVALLNAGYEITVIDSMVNSNPEALRRVMQITGKKFDYETMDLLNPDALHEVFQRNQIEAVIHFAGLKAVGESVAQPLKYYRNNISGTIHLLEAMQRHHVKRMVFSSSATVYGMYDVMPLAEDAPLSPINPYGRTKLMLEQILRDVSAADETWSVALLRYFNPVGAHESGQIGEDPNGTPNNLLPYITQVAVGRLPELTVHGDDYDTPDGTCIRDYIHVMDLAEGHVKALDYIMGSSGIDAFNLGTGAGNSVLDVIQAFEAASGIPIPKRIGPRRPGDAPISFAGVTKANETLGWRAQRDLQKMCADAWRWQSKNPLGYAPLVTT